MCVSYFFPISGRRPENQVLAGGQGRKNRGFLERGFCPNLLLFGCHNALLGRLTGP